MSRKLLRQVGSLSLALPSHQSDTVRRLAYAAPPGVGFMEWFRPDDRWAGALDIFGGLRALPPRTAAWRLRALELLGLLERSGDLVRLIIPVLRSTAEEVVKVARGRLSPIVARALSTAASVADFGALVRQGIGNGAAMARQWVGNGRPVSDGFLIEDAESEADNRGEAPPQGASAPAISGELDGRPEYHEGADDDYRVSPSRESKAAMNELVMQMFGKNAWAR